MLKFALKTPAPNYIMCVLFSFVCAGFCLIECTKAGPEYCCWTSVSQVMEEQKPESLSCDMANTLVVTMHWYKQVGHHTLHAMQTIMHYLMHV